MPVAIADDRLRHGEGVWIYDRRERAIAAHPLVPRIIYAGRLKLRAGAVVKIVSDVFLIGQQFMDRASGRRLADLIADPFAVENPCDFEFAPLSRVKTL